MTCIDYRRMVTIYYFHRPIITLSGARRRLYNKSDGSLMTCVISGSVIQSAKNNEELKMELRKIVLLLAALILAATSVIAQPGKPAADDAEKHPITAKELKE